jgi:alkylhydroperoxidase family enzyme
MHSLDARARGETEQRLYALPVWQETPFFSERERAALLWTEKLTLISLDHVPDSVYEQARAHFSEEELANLTLAIATINAWNRFGIAFRDAPGRYKPAKQH